jgi:hypothetical protein
MNKLRRVFLFLYAALSLVAFVPMWAQEGNVPANQPYGLRFLRSGIHSGNKVTSAFRNSGLLSSEQGPGASWPVPENTYLADINIMVGIQGVFTDTIVLGADTTRGTRVRDGRQNVLVRVPDRTVIRRFTLNGSSAVVVVDSSWYLTSHQTPRPFNTANAGNNKGGNVFWGITPYDGFRNPRIEGQVAVAMSHLPDTWPDRWPDQPTWIDPSTGRAQWNGYFGRGQTNADQESYFVATDGADRQWFEEYGYLPFPNNQQRYGAGLVLKVRGLQFATFLAQDCIFWLYDIKNTTSFDYDKVVFGSVVGTNVGGGGAGATGVTGFDQNSATTYSYKPLSAINDVSLNWNRRFRPGFAGLAFLESPGNAFDGIDNDNDQNRTTQPRQVAPTFNINGGTGPYDYNPQAFIQDPITNRRIFLFRRTLRAGDPIILIERATRQVTVTTFGIPETRTVRVFLRRYLTVPATDTTVFSLGRAYLVGPGRTLTEESNNLLDDNLNGLIDENYLLHVQRIRFEFDPRTGNILDRPPEPPLAYINYIQLGQQNPTGLPAGTGTLDPLILTRTLYPMIDERRDDGFDNNGNGFLDAVDVQESDQIGLTSYASGSDASFDLDNISEMVAATLPGRIDRVPVLSQAQSADYTYGTGYFPLTAGQTERFSIAMVFGVDADNVLQNKETVQSIYDANYNFARPPTPPTLRVYTDDRRVTLYWDAAAEEYRDEFIRRRIVDSLGVPLLPANTNDPRVKNFEGYKIYRATDNSFADALRITGSRGEEAQQFATYSGAQFDLINEVSGNFPLNTPDLLRQSRGIAYFLGENTGLVHSFSDTNVVNGKTYFYAVVAYNRGDTALRLYPSENSLGARDDGRGRFVLSSNVAVAVPGPKVAGYTIPRLSGLTEPVIENGRRLSGLGSVNYTVVDPSKLKDRRYEIQFTDTATDSIDNNSNGQNERTDVSELLGRTANFRILDITNPARADTLIQRNFRRMDTLASYLQRDETLFIAGEDVFDGMHLTIRNDIRGGLLPDSSYWVDANGARKAVNSYQIRPDSIRGFEFSPAARFTTFQRVDNLEFIVVPSGSVSSSFLQYRRASNGALTTIDPVPTNFIIRDRATGDTLRFIFANGSPTVLDTSGFEVVIPFSRRQPPPDIADSLFSYTVVFISNNQPGQVRVRPQVGDRYFLSFVTPFRKGDRFRFSTTPTFVSSDSAKGMLAKIKVVPNPYYARSLYERPLPATVAQGRGERRIYFTNVPLGATIRIYTIRGDLVQTLQQNAQTIEGYVPWDLRSRDNLDVAHGIYLYHVDAPGIGEKTDKFVLIK